MPYCERDIRTRNYMPHIRPDDCRGTYDTISTFVTTGSPMKFFLEPIAVALNYLKTQYSS